VLKFVPSLLIFRPFAAVDLETVKSRQVDRLRGFRVKIIIALQQHMRERSSKVSAIDISVALFRDVDVPTARTEDLDTTCPEFISHTYREYVVLLTHHSRTDPEAPTEVLLPRDRQSSWRHNEAGVNEAVEVCCFLEGLEVLLVL
jgi:hypothetical protein